jgi:hypothetical protein
MSDFGGNRTFVGSPAVPLYAGRMAIIRERLFGEREREVCAVADIDLRDRAKAVLTEPVFMGGAWGRGLP